MRTAPGWAWTGMAVGGLGRGGALMFLICLPASGRRLGVWGGRSASVSALSHQHTTPPRSLHRGKREEAAEAHRRFRSREGDHLSLLAVFRAYTGVSARGKERAHWCRSHFVNPRAMRKAVDIHEQVRGGPALAVRAPDRHPVLRRSLWCHPAQQTVNLCTLLPCPPSPRPPVRSSSSTWKRWACRLCRAARTRGRCGGRWWRGCSPMQPNARWMVSLPGACFAPAHRPCCRRPRCRPLPRYSHPAPPFCTAVHMATQSLLPESRVAYAQAGALPPLRFMLDIHHTHTCCAPCAPPPPSGTYRVIATGQPVAIHPSSVLHSSKAE
jgi:hypothetical protein